jgi:succinate dehydrogenase flavin-adding protein (antitoxin of CptAB toxin-antitoxin module)
MIRECKIGDTILPYDISCAVRNPLSEERLGLEYLGEGVIYKINGQLKKYERIMHFFKKIQSTMKEQDKFENFLNSELTPLGLSDKKTIDRVKWYYQTYFKSAIKEQVADYEEVQKCHDELVRELDVIINGENAAQQASLCDIVAQMRHIKANYTVGEQVDWDAAMESVRQKTESEMPSDWDRDDAFLIVQFYAIYLRFLQENYSLIPKPKPCNENTTSETKN